MNASPEPLPVRRRPGRRRGRFLLALLAASLAAHAPVRADLRLPRLFSEHAVLQRDAPVPVWGWAEPGREVTVAFAGQTHAAVAGADGRWQVALDPMPACAEGRRLTVASGGATLGVDDVLVGEVWLAAGQANMRLGGPPAADHSLIRHFMVGPSIAPVPRDTVRRGNWEVDAKGTTAFLSDVAGGFARRLQSALDVPVGMIVAAHGATTAAHWLNREGLDLFPGAYHPPSGAELEEQLRVMEAWNARESEYDRTRDMFARRLAARGEELTEARLDALMEPFKASLPRRHPWPAENGKIYNMIRSANCSVYNAMIAPLAPYRIRGVIWYQGEWDGGAETRAYFYHFAPLIAGWRAAWKQGAFPFLYVQLQNMDRGETPPPGQTWSWYAGVREAQRLALQMPATGMATIFDRCRGLHPANRQVPADRLARWALAYVYGRDGVTPSGPLYESSVAEGAQMRIRFRHAERGLLLRGFEGAESQFWIRASRGDFLPARAAVDGNDLLVWHPRVERPAAVRYAWNADAVAVLFNAEGLPASPFATDVSYPANFAEARARQAAYKEALRRKLGRLTPAPSGLPPPAPAPAVPPARNADGKPNAED